MRNESLNDYVGKLKKMASSATIIPRAVIDGGNWQPYPNKCHENVDIWCGHNSNYHPVRGWLYFDLPGIAYVKFVAHSVVRKPDGSLVDITPSGASSDYPFVTANLTDDEYDEILGLCQNHEIVCSSLQLNEPPEDD